MVSEVNKRYNKLIIKSPIEFDYLFHSSRRLSYKEVLTQYSRDRITRLAVLLNREYVDQPALKLCAMLNSRDPRSVQLYHRLKVFFDKEAYNNVEYVVAFETTSLELLRRAYSIPVVLFDANDNPTNIDNLQYATVKLITQINEYLMKYSINEDKKGNVAILTYTNNASNFDILHFNFQNEYLYQLVQAITFFNLLESKPKYDLILRLFYEKYDISNWREYVRTLVSVFCISMKKEGYISADLSIDVDSLLKRSVLDELSIDCNIHKIKYADKDEFDNEGNSDYKIFRDKPLLKLNNGDYVVHSRPLLIDRLYSSLYFDFVRIADEIENKHPDIPNLFTSDFMEKTMFCGLMRSCLSNKYEAFDEDTLKKIHKTKDGELGSPDYMIKNKTSLFLFECKDIRLNAWVKEKNLDYYFVLQNAYENGANLQEAYRWMERIGMGRFAQATMWLLHEVFGLEQEKMLCAMDEKEGCFLLDRVMAKERKQKNGEHGSVRWHLSVFKEQQSKNLHLLTHYPLDVLFSPLWLVRHFCWKRMWIMKHKELFNLTT